MSKSLRPILIVFAVILIAALALVLLIFVFPNNPSADDAEATPEATTNTSENVKIIDESDSDLVSFEMIPTDGESLLVEIDRSEDGKLSYTVTPAAEYFDYDTSKFRSMMFSLTSVSATNTVELNAPDLEKYGLADPWFIVRSTYADGRVIDLYLGNATPTDKNYYICIGGTNDVYTLGSYLVSLLTRQEYEYRDIELFPYYEEEDAYTNISYVKMTLRDGTEIELSLEDTSNFSEGNTMSSAYYMTLPTQSSCNDTIVQSAVIDSVAQLSSTGILADITEDEYAEYGFDNPAELEMRDLLGNSVDILVGGRYNSNYYYTMLKESPGTVIICEATAFDWLDVNYIELMTRTAWFVHITDLESIEYDLDGEYYLMEMEHGTRETEDGRTQSTVDATINGEPITETNCRRLFVRTLTFRIIGDVTDLSSIPTEAKYTITMHRIDGDDMVMELYELNDRQYALGIDGVVEYYIYKKNVTTLLNAFDTVMSGGELPMSFDS